MIALALLLAAAAPADAVAAERAFAAAARRDGQWTAFRRYADPTATMFVPAPVDAQTWLKGRRDPPRALRWSPTASFVSCDGAMAVNTGEWRGAEGSHGYFTTVWRRQPDGGWRWLLDHGDDLAVARARVSAPIVRRADCTRKPTYTPGFAYRSAGFAGGKGASSDGTLAYEWHIVALPARSLTVWLWTNAGWQEVLRDNVVPPKP